MKEVDILVWMLTHEKFISEHWMQSPCLFRAGEFFLKQSKLPAIEDMVLRHARELPRVVKVLHEGRAWSLRYMFPRIRKLLPAATLYLAHKKSLILYEFFRVNKFYNELATKLAEKFEARHQVGAIVTLGKTRGFNKHRDKHHVFVFQHIGESKWRVYDPTGKRLLMMKTLKPGSVLYLPRGFYHRAVRLTSQECHVSLALNYRSRSLMARVLYTNPIVQMALVPEERGLKGKVLERRIRAIVRA